MSTCFPAQTGDGTRAWLGDVNATCQFTDATYPAQSYSITVGATPAAAAALAITTVALPANVYIPPKSTKGGLFLEFIETGSTIGKIAELDNTAAIVAAGTSLTTKVLAAGIAAGAIAEWPVPFRGLTARDYQRQINAVQSAASDPVTGFVGSAPGTVTATVNLTMEVGNFASLFNVMRIAGTRQTAWLKLVFPQDSTLVRPTTVQGLVYFSALNRTSPNNTIQTVTTTANFVSDPVETYGLAV
jgi:hypothetical protein